MLKILQVDDNHDVTFKSKTVIITMTTLSYSTVFVRMDCALFAWTLDWT
jgi:hypothetical protein